MPGAGLAEARIAAERLRSSIDGSGFELSDGTSVPVTVSIGIAQAHRGEALDALLRRADEALYAAKTAGRNQVQAADNAAA